MTSEQDIKKIRELLEFLVKQNISEKINKLDTDEKKVYDLTGEKGQIEMAIITGFAAGKISKIWQKLESKGFLIKEGSKHRKVV